VNGSVNKGSGENKGDERTGFVHRPVLSRTLNEQISLPREGVMVDTTVGNGGHSLLLGSSLGTDGVLVGMDVDESSIGRASRNLSGLECEVKLVRSNFCDIERVLGDFGVGKADLILADLGFSSDQMADFERGLSFSVNMPLDMRLDDRLSVSAADIVNKESEKDLADLIYRFGEERASRRIARFIVQERSKHPINSTEQLALLVCRAVKKMPGKGSRIHPATRTFQALRIAVNDELGCLGRLLESSGDLLKPGGKIAIISFHSLEDRIVKRDFKEKSSAGVYDILTKRPLRADEEEVKENRRSRSAKLRIAQRR
jgi:16S rRNA (cytosine1402-N4)-methyltransferase